MKETSYDFLTTDTTNKEDQNYIVICQVLTKMVKAGVFNLCAGYCISMSDMIRTALKQRGIDSMMVESTLTITYFENEPPDIYFVGFSDMNNPGEIDTHVVLITNTVPAYLIDASIPHRLPNASFAVVQPIHPTRNFELINCKFDSQKIGVLYEQKKIQHIPSHHQESIIERIDTDRKIFTNLGYLKLLIILALIIGGINLIRGSYDFYQVYINDENTRGPSGVKHLDERLSNLEKLIKQSSK